MIYNTDIDIESQDVVCECEFCEDGGIDQEMINENNNNDFTLAAPGYINARDRLYNDCQAHVVGQRPVRN